MQSLKAFLPVTLGALLAIASRADAATFLVNSVADEVDVTPGDGTCAGLSGYCTLRAAVMEANSLPEPDSVRLPAGVYVLSIPGDAGLQDDGSRIGSVKTSDGDLDVLDDLEIVGLADRDKVVVDAIPSAPHLDRHFDVFDGVQLSLRSLTLTNGSGDQHNNEGDGGSIRSFGRSLVIRNVAFRDNSAELFGGAIITGDIRIENSLFERNRTLAAENGGAILAGGTLFVTDSVFRSNAGDDGGAIYRQGTLPFSVVRSQFIGNGAEAGGAIASYEAAGTIERSRFAGNGAYFGSAVNCDHCDIVESEFYGNGCGPVIVGAREIHSSTIVANDVASCGVGYGPIVQAVGSVINSTISGNVYGDYPVAVEASRVLFSTIVDNSTGESGGAVGAPLVFGSIIAGNTSRGEPADCAPGLFSMGRNLLGVADGCSTAPTDLVGSAAHPLDPRLEPIGSNGGPTSTHLLLRASPATDAIPIRECVYDADSDPVTPAVALNKDQRGARRPMQEACDIGAYEAGPACSDGIDNDGDGRVDYPADMGCISRSDPSEQGPRRR